MKIKIIGGLYRGRYLQTPNSNTRPTTGFLRESFYNFNQNIIEDIDFLDLFAGSGAMGLEAISRGAKSATFIEKDKIAASILRKNISYLEVEKQCKSLDCDVFSGIKKLQGKNFGIIYIDPPYEMYKEASFINNLLHEISRLELLKENGHLFVEAPKLKEFHPEGYILIKKRKYGKSYLYEFTI